MGDLLKAEEVRWVKKKKPFANKILRLINEESVALLVLRHGCCCLRCEGSGLRGVASTFCLSSGAVPIPPPSLFRLEIHRLPSLAPAQVKVETSRSRDLAKTVKSSEISLD